MSSLTPCKPIIFGCSGTELTSEERSFFKESSPFGFILFQRNIDNPDQVKELVSDLRETLGKPDLPIFIDKEGGRVSRLKPPHWPPLPSMRVLGEIYERHPETGLEAIRLHSQITAQRLVELGINGNCAPVLDLLIEGANDVIGDRAFSADPFIVTKCARVVIDTFIAHGIYPIVKHMPGHGRVELDPHIALPYVDTPFETLEAEDFIPFRELSDAPLGMTCHVVFRSLDKEKPVSLSPKIHEDIIRGKLGYEGLIVSDDLAMGALTGPLHERCIEALNAGSDIVMYCSGILSEMEAIAEALPNAKPESIQRWARAKERVTGGKTGKVISIKEMEEKFRFFLR